MTPQKIGRNSPCTCGCGRKFKVCMAEKQEAAQLEKVKTEAECLASGQAALNKIQLLNCVISGIGL